ncbi:tat pathway signal sequence, partial [Lojkania enalia]
MFYLVLYTLLSLLPGTLSRRYSLIRDYNASNFFDEFTFFTGQDPTGGFVTYVPFDNASATGLIHNSTGIVYLGVDHSNVYSAGGPGRPSVRLESRLTFTEGLFVLDLSHLPVGCGTWPAFWTVGLGDWPTDGEIDIIEGVNDAKGNDAALHATGECLVSSDVVQKSTWRSTNCNINHDGNLGCGVKFTEAGTYGNKFNLNGGGIYAMEWTNSAIKIWFFPPTLAPESLTSMSLDSSPDPSTYGIPSAEFSGPCSNSFPEKFFNHTIVIDTTFCGGWAGTRFGKDAGSICLGAEAASPEDSCKAFVGEHPEAFEEAYWAINSLRVWQ